MRFISVLERVRQGTLGSVSTFETSSAKVESPEVTEDVLGRASFGEVCRALEVVLRMRDSPVLRPA